jgi:galactoside O-acetyltransferase
VGVKLSRRAALHGIERIALGDHCRIDDFCVISAGAGGIAIGRHVHIAAFCLLAGAARIELHDYAGLSSRVSLYSSSDDYSGAHMTNPTVPREYSAPHDAPVTLGRHVIVGSGSVILPGVTLHEGSGVGALSLVRSDCEALGLYFGTPAKRIGHRKPDMLHLGDVLEGRLAPA